MLATKSEVHRKALKEVFMAPWAQGGLMPREARRLILVLLSENPSPPTTVPYLCRALRLDSKTQVDRLRRVVRDLYRSGYLTRRRSGGDPERRFGQYIYRITLTGIRHLEEKQPSGLCAAGVPYNRRCRGAQESEAIEQPSKEESEASL